MKLVHHTNGALGPIHSTEQPPERSFWMKPKGLWVSVVGKDSWAEWCGSENFSLGVKTYEVTLSASANVLRMKSPKDLDEFTDKYGTLMDFQGWPHSTLSNKPGIDWARVAQDYQGIIIAPYIWERRMSAHTFWYYGWDCASGCIWDGAAIDHVALEEKQ